MISEKCIFLQRKYRRNGNDYIKVQFDNPFAASLEALLRNSKGVDVMEKHITKQPRSRKGTLVKAIEEEKEGKVTTYASVDELFEDLGI